MIYYEVRCCCHPDNLLGWLPAPATLRPGQSYHFPVTRHLSRWSPRFTTPLELRALTLTLTLTLKIYSRTWRQVWQCDTHPSRPLEEWFRHSYPAFDSNHQPLEVFRHIPAFLESGVHNPAFFPPA
jgi:hypothetical protein